MNAKQDVEAIEMNRRADEIVIIADNSTSIAARSGDATMTGQREIDHCRTVTHFARLAADAKDMRDKMRAQFARGSFANAKVTFDKLEQHSSRICNDVMAAAQDYSKAS